MVLVSVREGFVDCCGGNLNFQAACIVQYFLISLGTGLKGVGIILG